MKCKFSIPVGQQSRYRSYGCNECGHHRETVEIDLLALPLMPEEIRLLNQEIAKARGRRFTFTRKKTPTG